MTIRKPAYGSGRACRSTTPAYSIGSVGSFLSVGSVGSVLSVGSVGSVLSVGSVGSALSLGSVGSSLSVFSVGSVLSVGSVGSAASVFSVGAWRGERAALRDRAARWCVSERALVAGAAGAAVVALTLLRIRATGSGSPRAARTA
ncbi:hypothetical protein [Streptomyces sp. NPDC006334]|uniref:hypothetical protein n=1 Tax=Streptomyces sp. NPDC006334 TaxID=3156754 RepID=UPI0033AD5DA5